MTVHVCTSLVSNVAIVYNIIITTTESCVPEHVYLLCIQERPDSKANVVSPSSVCDVIALSAIEVTIIIIIMTNDIVHCQHKS